MEATERTERDVQTHEAVDTLIHSMRAHHRVVERRIEGMGVHHSQHRMLMRLDRMGRMASQKEIADALDVSPACVARTLKHLSAAGLIDKQEGQDNRRNEISITPAGRQMIEETLNTFLEIDRDMFAGISESELTALIRTMRRVQQNLADMERPGAESETEETCL